MVLLRALLLKAILQNSLFFLQAGQIYLCRFSFSSILKICNKVPTYIFFFHSNYCGTKSNIQRVSLSSCTYTKGQLISEWIFGVFKSPKSQPNIYQISALASLGRNLSKIWLAFREIWRHQKFHLTKNWWKSKKLIR